MKQAPNVFILAFANTTITFGWNIPGDTPNAIRIQRDSPNPKVFGEFTNNNPGFFSTSFQDTNLQPGTLYEYSVCCEYLDQTLCGTVVQRTTGTLPPPPPPPPVIMQITGVQAHPRHLEMIRGAWTVTSNEIDVSWASSGPIAQLNVELDSTSGSLVRSGNFAGAGFPATSGTVNESVPTPGDTYLVKVRGETTGGWTDFSPSVQITTPSNFHSLRGFLAASGVSGSNGIKGFLPGRPLSLRFLLGI